MGKLTQHLKDTKDYLNTRMSIAASNVLMNTSSVAIDNTIITKNFSEVLYTGNGDTQTIETGISSIDFTQSGNGTGYYNKRVGKGFAVVKDDAVDHNTSSNVTFYESGRIDSHTYDDGDATFTVTDNSDDSDNEGYIELKIDNLVDGQKYFVNWERDVDTTNSYGALTFFNTSDDSTTGERISISKETGGNIITGKADQWVRLGFYTNNGADVVNTFSNLSILPIETSGSLVANTSKVHIKGRSIDESNIICDGLRGARKRLSTNSTTSEMINNGLVSFNANGISLDADSWSQNTDTETYVLYQELYTHIKWQMTSHNKLSLEAYNPITKQGMIMYSGSGSAGHEIPHSVGGELDVIVTKSLDASNDWFGYNNNSWFTFKDTAFYNDNSYSQLTASTISFTKNTTGANLNGIHIAYYKAKSQTFTNGTYIGTGVAGNKIVTTDVNGDTRKPLRVIVKRIDDVGDWRVFDAVRENSFKVILLNSSVAEADIYSAFNLVSDGFISASNGIEEERCNALNGQYYYEVEFDTNAGTTPDGSYFNLPTDNTNLNITNGTFISTTGIDGQGYVHNTESFTGTIDFSGVSDGIKWVGKKADNSFIFLDKKPEFSGDYVKTSADDNRWLLNKEDGRLYDTVGGELIFDYLDINNWTDDANNTTTIENGQIKIVNTDSTAWTTGITISCDPSETYMISSTSADGTMIINGVKRNPIVSGVSEIIIKLEAYTNSTVYFDNISVYKTKPTIGTMQEPTSFLKKPVMVASETPMMLEADSLADTVLGDVVAGNIECDNIEAKDIVADTIVSKNQCTAWVNFDGRDGSIRDSFNVAYVLREATGKYRVYFDSTLETPDYSATITAGWDSADSATDSRAIISSREKDYFRFLNREDDATNNYIDNSTICVSIMGGIN